MNVIFFGTGEYGVETLEKLIDSEHEVLLVVTQPDSKQGRGHKVKPSPIKIKALELGVEIYQPENINSTDSIEKLKDKKADIFIVISYGSILKNELLNMPLYKCINSHPSLLPLYRGAAPVQRTLMNGDKKTGVSIIEITENLDAGDILAQEEILIDDSWNFGDLTKKLSKIGGELIIKVLDAYNNNSVIRIKQNENFTYAKKIINNEKYLNINLSGIEIKNKIRGLFPALTPMLIFNNQLIGITEVEVSDDLNEEINVGEVLRIDKKKGILVKCGIGGIWILKLKPEGKKEMKFLDYLNGSSIKVGDKFSSKGE